MKTLSDEYKKVLVATHAACKGWGTGGKYYPAIVSQFADALWAKSILDYGCGQGVLKERLSGLGSGLDVREYDPGIAGKDGPPQSADLVVCTDVLEHVEPEYVDAALTHMRTLARKGLFAVIALSPANLILTDGRNAHLTVQPAEWWLAKLRANGFHIDDHKCPKGLHVWALCGG